MSSRWKLQFSWRGVFLIGIGLALIALAIVFRSLGGPSASGSSGPAEFHWSAVKTLLETVGVGLLFAVAVLLGAWFGLVHRLRKSSQLQRQDGATRET